MAKYKYVQGVLCLGCGDKIWSRHTHNFRVCTCKATFVDGGGDYMRFGWEPGTKAHIVKMRVPLEEWLRSDRNPKTRIRSRFPY